jgi:hypothetical protein
MPAQTRGSLYAGYTIEDMKIVFQGEQPPRSGKFLVNEDAVIFFPHSQQHREIKLLGLSYQEDGGNALAGIILVKRIDIRFHKHFSDERIRSIWHQLQAEPQLSFMHGWELFYRGQQVR